MLRRALVGGRGRELGEVAEDLSTCLRDAQVTLFAGAGISRPSGLPLAGDIKDEIIRRVCGSLAAQGIAAGYTLLEVEDTLRRKPLERLLEALQAVYGPDALDVLGVLDRGAPNFNHEAVARLVGSGLLSEVITLNFDVLFETAILGESIPLRWHLPLADTVVDVGGGDPRVRVTKPHGTRPLLNVPYADHYLAATLKDAGDRPSPLNMEAIEAISRRAPVLLVAGYNSRADWDIWPILASIEWSSVFWCEFERDGLTDPVRTWLEVRERPTWLVEGDVRGFLFEVLGILDVPRPKTFDRADGGRWTSRPLGGSRTAAILADDRRNSFAAIALLDGMETALYGELLKRFGEKDDQETDPLLWADWLRATAWHGHIHDGSYRTAVALRQKAATVPRSTSLAGRAEALGDLVGLYYEHLCLVKRPYQNLRAPIDLAMALRLRERIHAEAEALSTSATGAPWLLREIGRLRSRADYYLIDVYHNWMYHLLPFGDALIGWVVRRIAESVAGAYASLFERYPSLRWEYFYLRSVEAGLLADRPRDRPRAMDQLVAIADMFGRIGENSHLMYARGLLAIWHDDFRAFAGARDALADPKLDTPSAAVRMVLLQRWFWPRTLSAKEAMRTLIRRGSMPVGG